MNKAVKINSHLASDQAGFTLMEVVIALIILMIALLGVFYTFSYAVNYNFSNSQRAQALSIVQQEIESMRSARFTPAIIDQALIGGEKTPKLVTTTDGNVFLVQIMIDDDPFTAGLQIDNTKPFKEITVSVTNENPGAVWQSSVPARAVIRRVRGY
jgi:prepilin-type N-terminal cleavage/methylation domain-containing protein